MTDATNSASGPENSAPAPDTSASAQKNDKQGSEHLNVKVVGSDNSEVQFKIKRSTPLKKLMEAYCQRSGKGLASVRFLFDGTRINETDTPQGLEMEDGDTIDCMPEQTGGSQ
eukprot:TRINITY_DN25275_c0_g1_i1.p1 TRINITY_DN25275_c0_g1~~TRINITY_DN25275_c0_g1_i1.p1  ORF type:complete len:113 (-),score=15.85 TRINITY_DN25275_c0_g1_i1:72-410(-)